MKLFQLFVSPVILLFGLLVLPQATHAKSYKTDIHSECGGTFDLCGFKDPKTEQFIIPQKFEKAASFLEDGLTRVRIKGLYGYINKQGIVKIKPKYEAAGDFHFGLAEVMIKGKAGVINIKGRMIVKPQFSRAFPFSKDLLLVSNDPWVTFYDHPDFKEKLDSFDNRRHQAKERLYHIRKGYLSKKTYHFKPFNTASNKLLWAKKADVKNALWGLMRADGRWHIQPSYIYVDRVSSNRCIVINEKKLNGALDATAKLVIPFSKQRLGIWQNGMSSIYDHSKEGLLDINGKLIGDRYFTKAETPKKGSTIGRVQISGQWHGITPKGKLVADPLEGSVLEQCASSGLSLLHKSGKRQIVNAQNKPIVPFILEKRTFLNCNGLTKIHYKSGWSLWGSNKKWNFIDQTGKLLHPKPLYDGVGKPENSLYPVRKGSQWGLLSEAGKMVLDFQYDSLTWSGNAHLKASKNGATTWFNAKAQPYPTLVENNEGEIMCYKHYTKLIKREGLWGIATPRGKIIIKPAYQAINCFSGGVAMAALMDKKLWCPIEPDGVIRSVGCVKKLYPPATESVMSAAEQLDPDPFKSNVLWIRSFRDFTLGVIKTYPKTVSRKLKLPKNTIIIRSRKR